MPFVAGCDTKVPGRAAFREGRVVGGEPRYGLRPLATVGAQERCLRLPDGRGETYVGLVRDVRGGSDAGRGRGMSSPRHRRWFS